ncbi:MULTISPECIES: lipase family protein [unclassified Brenneria]|uniref:lipase family protein n=1 Tax=unclassified Brenneria TaxID=2634434 RepID=UPI0029C45D5A|nr:MULTISPECIES: lipase family protein [unclassified Brenneria]MDX5631036.1 lipase family protein [Brenneria sp. L3-3Z]MDX5698127.1 lipase family protein [Brenneria sp. L4-2C]
MTQSKKQSGRTTATTSKGIYATMPDWQKKHWVEFLLLDEQGKPVADMPYLLRAGDGNRKGKTDAQGLLREDNMPWFPVYLLVAAQPLADEMEKRELRPLRGEEYSDVKVAALEDGHQYRYVRIGEISDGVPAIEKWSQDRPPTFHFPKAEPVGFRVDSTELDRRHVLEICPFRAWSLVLHHQPDYSLVNAYNLSLMAVLSYAKDNEDQSGSITHLFNRQMLDLSSIPNYFDIMKRKPVVKDVPFSQRYTDVGYIDSLRAAKPEGSTQLFYAANVTEIIVVWRGTEMTSWADIKTDGTFRPQSFSCEIKVPCIELSKQGKVHKGFWDGFCLVDSSKDGKIQEKYQQMVDLLIVKRKLFVCGHSLGGALALLYAAKNLDKNPVLYTYGMPRTFTINAIRELQSLIHFRHINANDAVTSVPPERALDNYLYDLWGPLGTTLGFTWSLLQLLHKGEEYFGHQGETVHFCELASTQQWYDQDHPTRIVRRRLPKKAKLLLAPSLSETENQQAKDNQHDLMQRLDTDSKKDYFPRWSNPALKDALNLSDHSSLIYAEYLGERLAEVTRGWKSGKYYQDKQAFRQQLAEYQDDMPKKEYQRNLAFLALDDQLAQTLLMTRESSAGQNALLRYINEDQKA